MPRAQQRKKAAPTKKITPRRVNEVLERFLSVPRQKRERTLPLDMLVGTLLSQNTNDRNSHKAYVELRRRYPTWAEVAEAPVSAIASAIKIGGMKNQKSSRIKALLGRIERDFGSLTLKGIEKMEDDEVVSLLTSYHGIGVKTAACVLLFSLRRDVFPVDTHVHRICNRLGLVTTNTPEKTFEAMKGRVPDGKAYALHTNLIRFGRTVCLSQRPRCGQCPFYNDCQFQEKARWAAMLRPGVTRENADFMLLDEI